MMEKSTNAKLIFPFLSIYASVPVNTCFFEKEQLLEVVFLVAILMFWQSRLLFSQHVVEDCAVLADYVLCFV